MPRSCMPSNVMAVLFSVFFALACFTLNAAAQGFPGGGGHGGGRGGAHAPPSGAKPSSSPAAQPAADPLATFLGSLHTLRMELLVRQEQVELWTGMQDALRAYVDLEKDRSAASDPVVRLRNLAADAHARADALQNVSESVAALVAALDDHQRQTFSLRLGDAFAQPGARG
jgi:hypothetical protein